jgi:hypothetical protein
MLRQFPIKENWTDPEAGLIERLSLVGKDGYRQVYHERAILGNCLVQNGQYT